MNKEENQGRDGELSSDSIPEESNATTVNNTDYPVRDEELFAEDLNCDGQQEEIAKDEAHNEVLFY